MKAAGPRIADLRAGEPPPLPKLADGEEKRIRIACESQALARLDELEHFQGDLKVLYRREFEKLARSLHEVGFFDPVLVWRNPKDKKRYVIDGHQRLFVARTMVKHGWRLDGGKVPVDHAKPKSEDEAREMVLLALSQYGTVTEESVAAFVQSNGLDWEKVRPKIDIPQIHMGKLQIGWFDGTGKLEKGLAKKDDDDSAWLHKCPQCGFEF